MTRAIEAHIDSVEVLYAELAQRPNDSNVLRDLAATLLASGDLAAAHGFATRAAELAHSDSRPVRLLAQALLGQERTVEAVGALAARRAAFEHEPGYLLALARAQRANGEDVAARATLHAVLRTPHDYVEAHLDLAASWREVDQPGLVSAHLAAARSAVAGDQGLAQAYTEYLATAPGDFAAVAFLARAHLDAGRYSTAGRLWVRLIEIDDVAGRALVTAQGDHLRDACAHEDLAHGGSATLFEQRGLLLHVLGERDRAKTCYERALMRKPDAEFAAAMLAGLNRAMGLPEQHVAFALDALENVALNAHELAERAIVLTSTPAIMEIASTNVCNIDPPCVQCWKHVDPSHGWLNDDARHLSQEQIETIAPFVRRTRSVSLHGIGEPLANPHLFETVRWCSDATAVVFVSNALLFNATRIDRVLAHRVALIDFSLDAGSAETYRKIRHNDFDKAIGNIASLIAERDRRGLDKPAVVINMCLMRENVADIPAFVQLAHDLRATSAHIFHMNHGASYRFAWFDYAAQHCANDPETHDRYVEEGFALAARLGVHLQMSGRRRLSVPDDERQQWGGKVARDRFFCGKPWDSLLVQVNGDVFNCCWQSHPLSSLQRESLWQTWNGPLLREVRESTARGEPHPVCTGSASRCPLLGRE